MGMMNTDSPFVSYNLDEKERQLGSLLQEGQKQVIQNMLFQAAMKKVNLSWTPDNIQSEAELQGEIRAYQSILDNHKEAEAYFAALVVFEQEQNQMPMPTNLFGSRPVQ